jgi:hypothetical protein
MVQFGRHDSAKKKASHTFSYTLNGVAFNNAPLCAALSHADVIRRARSADRRLLHLAEADRSVGLPNTRRQPSLKLARCLRMHAVIRATLGISDEQSRNASPIHSLR